MALVSVGSFCQSVKNNSLLIKAKQENGFELIRGQKQNLFITPNLLDRQELDIFNSFLSLLGLEFGKHLTNYGLSIFDTSLQHVYFTSPSIGIADDKLVLMIGAESGTHKAAYLPLVFDGKLDDEGVMTGDYSIMTPGGKKVKCSLISIPNPMDSAKTNHYIGIKNKEHQFQIPFKAASNDLSSAYINECWDEGRFNEVCRSFLKASGSLSKMFKPCFTDEYFPTEGVLLLLSNGQVQPSDQYGASSRWTINWCSHPNLLVNDNTKDNPVLLPLAEIGTVFAPKSCKATTYCVSQANRGMTSPYYVIHIKGVNRNSNTGHIPDHAGCDNAALLDFVLGDTIIIQKFPEVIEKTMQLATGQLQQQMSGIKQAALVGSDIDEPAF